jgi:glycosyltransferase involved in cell wall biosynthesis
MKKLRVVFVTNEYVTESESHDGGIANQFRKYALGLKGLGHQAVVVVKSAQSGRVQCDGIDVHRVPFKESFAFKVINFITRFKFQKALSAYQLGYCFKKKVKELHKEHGFDVAQYSSNGGYAVVYEKSIPTVLVGASYDKSYNVANEIYNKGWVKRQMEIVNELVFKAHANIFVPSYWLKNILKNELNISSELIETPFLEKELNEDDAVANDIDLTSGGQKYLLYFGRMGIWKGVIDIANALPSIFDLDSDFYFVFVGKDKGYKETTVVDYLKEKAGKQSHRLLHYSNVIHEQLFPIIRKAYAVVLPSRAENFSNACVETLSLGKVLIGTRGASFDQLITDGENGFLCEIEQPETITNAVEKVLRLTEREKREIEIASKEVTKRLQPDVVIQQLLNFYNKSIKGHAK